MSSLQVLLIFVRIVSASHPCGHSYHVPDNALEVSFRKQNGDPDSGEFEQYSVKVYQCLTGYANSTNEIRIQCGGGANFFIYNGVNSVILDCYPATCANDILEEPDHSTLTARLTDGYEFTCDTGFSAKRGSLDNKITATCDSDNHNEGMVDWWCLELGGDFSIFDDYDFDYRKQSETVWHNGNLNIPG